MSKWQNLSLDTFLKESVGKYNMPTIEPVYEVPEVDRFIEFDYCQRLRADRYDRSRIGVHFFEDDYKFERVWMYPDRYGQLLQEFGYILGPDFSTYTDFPFPVTLYNHWRNRWLVRRWQTCYNIIVVPTIMWGYEDTWDWCFDGYPKHSIVAVSNIGQTKSGLDKQFFHNGYAEMLDRLEPSKILVFSRNCEPLPGNVEYIRWEIHKGDQLKDG